MRRAWPLFFGVAAHAQAADRAIEEVRLARENGVAIVDVVLVVPRRLSRPRAGGRRRGQRADRARGGVPRGRRYRHSQRAARAASNHGGRDPAGAVRYARWPRGDGQRQGQPGAAFHGEPRPCAQHRARRAQAGRRKLARAPTAQLPPPEPVACRASARPSAAAHASTVASRAASSPSGASVTRSSSPPEQGVAERSALGAAAAGRVVYVNEHEASGGALAGAAARIFRRRAGSARLRGQLCRRLIRTASSSSPASTSRIERPRCRIAQPRAERRGCRSRAGSGTRLAAADRRAHQAMAAQAEDAMLERRPRYGDPALLAPARGPGLHGAA